MRDQEISQATPPAVIGAISLGVAPLPFLAVYAVLFIAHGFVYPVQPPDITGSATGEGLAGIVAAVLFLIGTIVIWWFLNGTRRWPFVIAQLATLATSIDFVFDHSSGPRAVSLMLAGTSAIALVLSATPSAWVYMGFGGRDRAEAEPSRAVPHAADARV